MARLRSRHAGTEIYSIYGQIEEVAADIMLQDGRATLKIPFTDMPASQQHNEQGARARCAVLIPRRHVQAFETLIRDLYA